MSKLEELIQELCPNGVEYKPLEEIGTLTRGKRFVHADAVENGVPCIHYGEIYTFYGISTIDVRSHIREELRPKMRYAQKNDVIIVGAGENNIDIGVGVAYLGDEAVAVHDACYIFHHNEDPVYISYCLRTQEYHRNLKKYVSEGKICSISAASVGRMKIPVPPLPVQREIVRILDGYTERVAQLTEELAAELTARQKQYEYYRDQLLNFDVRGGGAIECRWRTLGEVATAKTGRKPNDILESGRYEYINAGTTNSGYVQEFNCNGDVVTTPSRGQGGIGYVGYQPTAFWLGPLCYGIKANDSRILSNKFLYYVLCGKTDDILKRRKEGGTPALNASDLLTIKVPVPPLDVQQRIVHVLDNFDAICSDLNIGLPAEIEARQKQYEYYRDKLLTFQAQ